MDCLHNIVLYNGRQENGAGSYIDLGTCVDCKTTIVTGNDYKPTGLVQKYTILGTDLEKRIKNFPVLERKGANNDR